MNKFYEYLLSIGEFYLMVDEDSNIRTSENKYELGFCYTLWTGIYDTSSLNQHVVYSIKNLIKED